MKLDARASKHESSAPADCRHRSHHAGSHLLQPFPRKSGCETQKYDRHREDPDHLLERPVPRGAYDDPLDFHQRRVENAPGIDGTDAEMDCHRSRWNLPTIEAGWCNNPFFQKNIGHDPRL